jgi:hypothetical protein
MTSFIAISCPSGCPLRSEVVLIDKCRPLLPHGRRSRSPACVAWASTWRRLAPRASRAKPPRQLSVPASDRAYGRSSCARIRGRITMQDRLASDAGSPGRQLGQLPRSPSNRVNQKLAVSSSDDFSAGLEISVRIGELALQLGDAIDQQVHILFHGIGWTLGTAHGVSVPGSLAVFINQGEIQTTSTGTVLRSRRHSCRGQVGWSGDGCTSIGRAIRRSPRRNHPAPSAEWFAHAPSLRGFRLMQPMPLTRACRSPRRCFCSSRNTCIRRTPRPRL